MSNVISWLEQIGQDAGLKDVFRQEIKVMPEFAQLDNEVKNAVLAKDQQKLAALHGTGNSCCMLFFDEESESENNPEFIH